MTYESLTGRVQEIGHEREGDIGQYLPPSVIGCCDVPDAWRIWGSNDPAAGNRPRWPWCAQYENLLPNLPERFLQVIWPWQPSLSPVVRSRPVAGVQLCLDVLFANRYLRLAKSLSEVECQAWAVYEIIKFTYSLEELELSSGTDAVRLHESRLAS